MNNKIGINVSNEILDDFIYNYQNDNMRTICPNCKGIMIYPINEAFKFTRFEIDDKTFCVDICAFCKKKFKFELDFSQLPDNFKLR